MVKITWSNETYSDLIEIYNYILKDSIHFARKTIDEILNKVDLLYDFPYLGEKIYNISNVEYRRLIYKSYKIIYEIDSEEIFILRILHSARKDNILFLK